MRSALAVAMVACSAPAPAPIRNAAPATPTVVLHMERSGCGFTACAEYTIEIVSDGTVRWHGERHVFVLGDRVSHIAPADVRRILAAFERIGFFTLAGPPPRSRLDCSSGQCATLVCGTDGPSTDVTIVRQGTPHHYEADDCNSPLVQPAELVEQIVGAKAWIGQRADDT